jgi:hypothetical protein
VKQAIEGDVVVIYFAGHGSPESPDSAQNLFFVAFLRHNRVISHFQDRPRYLVLHRHMH